MRKFSAIERFFNKVEKQPSGCWHWTGCCVKHLKARYGQIFFNKRLVMSHRFSYEFAYGKIPKGLTINHDCNNTICVRPSHLTPMTLKKNLLIGNGVCAIHARKTHCILGHEFNKKNTYRHPDNNGRRCRECTRIKHREYYKRDKMLK